MLTRSIVLRRNCWGGTKDAIISLAIIRKPVHGPELIATALETPFPQQLYRHSEPVGDRYNASNCHCLPFQRGKL
jgi:hypothetical protein